MLYTTPAITVYCCFLAAAFGACMGSFLNCMAGRMLAKESFIKGRSHCDACKHQLSARDLVPVASYLISGGKCRYCGAKIPACYIWTELLSAAVFVSILLRFDISLQVLEYLVFASIMLVCSFTDLGGYIIPDIFIIIGTAVRLVFILISGEIGKQLLYSAIGGIGVAGGLLLVVLIAEKIRKKEAMGGGDIKLLFMTGIYLGWQRNLLTILLSCFLGILFYVLIQSRNKTEKAIPWGPSIAAAAWVSLLVGNEIITVYCSLF